MVKLGLLEKNNIFNGVATKQFQSTASVNMKSKGKVLFFSGSKENHLLDQI